ncbi:30S ribosomal protein S3 [Candidatus Woesearchaeota archaeon]|nr:30S ribosomal protein S3 [Candidatus Woesearchaeota archaeon]
MIEREFVEQKKKEFQIQEFVSETLKNAGHSHTKLQRTPLGEKVVIFTSRPGLIVGRKGQTISKLTEVLKKKFGLENPQVEISEVSNPLFDARIVAERIASELERFGSNRFKGIMHKALEDVLAAGAVGVELRLSGKLPGARAKRWRVAGGYLRKCGDAAVSFVNKSIFSAQLKPGVIGIQVKIMPPGIVMPDEIRLIEEAKQEQPVASAESGNAAAESGEAAAATGAEGASKGAKGEKQEAGHVEVAVEGAKGGAKEAEAGEAGKAGKGKEVKAKSPRKGKSGVAASKSKSGKSLDGENGDKKGEKHETAGSKEGSKEKPGEKVEVEGKDEASE